MCLMRCGELNALLFTPFLPLFLWCHGSVGSIQYPPLMCGCFVRFCCSRDGCPLFFVSVWILPVFLCIGM